MEQKDKNRKKILILFITLLITYMMLIFLVLPQISYSILLAKRQTTTLSRAIELYGKRPFYSAGKLALDENRGVYGSVVMLVGLLFFSLFVYVVIKRAAKGDYENIEHGSSDWSEGGEQYSVLSKTKGILLAEKNYLPLDKAGNVNVLVIGGSGSRKVFIICNT